MSRQMWLPTLLGDLKSSTPDAVLGVPLCQSLKQRNAVSVIGAEQVDLRANGSSMCGSGGATAEQRDRSAVDAPAMCK